MTLFRRHRFDADLAEELRGHISDREAHYIREGLSPADARRRAALDFGNAAVIHEASRDVWIVRAIDDLRSDLVIAARTIRNAPAFACAAIATFALGIGAATAIFSVAYGVAFRPLPYPDAGRIVRIYESNTRTGEPKHQVSRGTFHGWREVVTSLEQIALFRAGGVSYTAGDAPQPLTVASVSPAFFDVLGASPLLGRAFKREAEYTRYTTNEFVISHAAWHRLFGGDPGIAGRLFYIAEDDDPVRVVGVMPRDFAFDAPVDAWRPTLVQPPIARGLRSVRNFHVVGRLRADRSLEDLRAELDVAAAGLARDFPATNAGWMATAEPLRDAIIGRFGPASWLFLAAVAAVLLAACANVAGLLTARAMVRSRETSVRIALGAGRWRLAQLWITEALLLASIGAAFGVALAWWLVRALRAAAPPGLPRVEHIAVDLPALAIAAAATVIAGVVCALVPLWTTRARHLPEGLSAGSARTGDPSARRRVSGGLVILQSGAALALVVLSIVFARSFLRLTSVDLGWRPDRLLSLDLSPQTPAEIRRPWFWYAQWADRLVGRLEATPGIERAVVTTSVPFSGVSRAEIARGPAALRDETRWPVGFHVVTSGYFETLGLSLRSGRLFTRDDRFDETTMTAGTATARGVAIVSDSVARTLWPGEDPIGKVFRLPAYDNTTFREVVGVVADVQFAAVGAEPTLEVFLPRAQTSTGGARLIVRAAGDPAAIASVVRGAVLAEHAATGINRVTVVDALVERSMAPSRLTAQLLAVLGALALVLAAVGVFGALSMLVTAGARETAVRMALGASPSGTMWRALARGLLPVCVGAAGGVLTAFLLVGSARSLLFGIDGLDGVSLVLGSSLVLAVTTLACIAPAVRAARTDPLQALRGD